MSQLHDKALIWRYKTNCLISPDQQLPEGIERMAAVIEYDGSSFCGWQRQLHSPSVQAEVEKALSNVANQSVSVACAGRTDTGVSGTNQFIHFDTSAQRNPHNWIMGANANLPDSIRLHWAQQMPAQFHVRFSALSRTYRYIICNDSYRPALFCKGLTWERRPLNADNMHRAAQHLLGEQDFTSVRAAGCQSNTPFRNVHCVDVWRQGELVIIEIKANAFLLHMVRNIAGILISVGKGARSSGSVKELLSAKNRCHGEVTARPNGLYLVGVGYPNEFNVPPLIPGPHFVVTV
jgi:tRNA pseudouridine38-40 synthase